MTEEQSEGRARLQAYADRMKRRYTDVEEIFKGAPYAPADNKDFIKFLKDMTTEAAARYVMSGVLTALDEVPTDPGDPDRKARELRAKGFTVSGDPKVAAEIKNETKTEKDPEGTKAVPETTDAEFLDSTLIRHARELGFDPNADDDEERYTTKAPRA